MNLAFVAACLGQLAVFIGRILVSLHELCRELEIILQHQWSSKARDWVLLLQPRKNSLTYSDQLSRLQVLTYDQTSQLFCGQSGVASLGVAAASFVSPPAHLQLQLVCSNSNQKMPFTVSICPRLWHTSGTTTTSYCTSKMFKIHEKCNQTRLCIITEWSNFQEFDCAVPENKIISNLGMGE